MARSLEFWSEGPFSPMLRPLSWLYGAVATRRFENAKPVRVAAPVICIGNPTVGGAGKTPTAMAVAVAAKELGRSPAFVTRGYGRTKRLVEPARVDSDRHDADAVGDEPLLLSRVAPTFVATDRAEAAKVAIAEGSDLIVMDDGFQSRRLHVDEAVLLIDRANGTGNGLVLPAGPLRMPLARQLTAADTLVVIDTGGASRTAELTRLAARGGLHVVHGRSELTEPDRWRDRDLVLFCGLADPSKFTRAIEMAGGRVVAQWNFADHHRYTERDAAALVHLAAEKGGALVTTAKDAAKLPTLATPIQYEVAEQRLTFDPGALVGMVRRATEAYRKRR